jgi:ABC-type lipoprotein release transport system permease subunit
MPLVFTLAFRNLFHDRLRLIATVIGIVFSIVLVMVQMGLYFGFGRMVTTMIDNASADLWVMPKGTKCFEDPSLLDARQRNRALSVPGIAEAIRAGSIAKTPHAMLSRGVAGTIGATLVVNLPGSPGGCRDGFAVIRPAVEHALRLLADEATSHRQT